MAKAGFRILDSDLHLMESADLYERYLAQEYRHRVPRAGSSLAGHYAGWMVDGHPVPPWSVNPQVLKANKRLDVRFVERQLNFKPWRPSMPLCFGHGIPRFKRPLVF